jgi:hypothetical protein
MKSCIVLLLGCLIGVAPAAEPAASPSFRAGAATSNITSPLGGGIIGGFVPIPATHVHDELHVRCLVLDDGQTQLALAVCDLLGIHFSVSAEARKLVQESTGIPPERVLICATHTHSACSTLGQRFQPVQPLDEYQSFVARRIADGIKCAQNNLRPAQIAFGTAEAPEHVFNRRWFMKPGTMPANPFGGTDQVKMNPPAGSSDLVEPAGPTDPTVSFLAVREPEGSPIAVFAAYSLHYVGGVGPGHISADYYGMYCRHLERLMQAEDQELPMVAMLANGTSGDINNINFRTPRPRQGAYVQMRAVAEDVAAKVHAALAKAEYRERVTLAASYRELDIARREVTADQLEWANKTLAERPLTPGKADLPAIYADRTLRMAEAPPSIPVALQVLRIGEVCIGTMPCEVLCEIGLDFKKRSPLQPAFLVSLAHGYLGYLPTPHQHSLGGYETWMATNRLERNASDKMLDALLEMAAELKPASGQ